MAGGRGRSCSGLNVLVEGCPVLRCACSVIPDRRLNAAPGFGRLKVDKRTQGRQTEPEGDVS